MDPEHDSPARQGPVFTTEKTEAYKQCAQGPELVIMERALYSQKDSRTLPSHPHLTVK